MYQLMEHFGVSVAAITGVLAARGKNLDLFGVIVLAVVTAFGGGTVRDIFLGTGPVFWIYDPSYLYNATLTAILVFFVSHIRQTPKTVLVVADAFALAFFTMVGTQKGIAVEAPAAVCVAMGVITGVAGGIIRDVLTSEIPLVFRPFIYLYATAALIGSMFYLMLNHWLPDTQRNLIIGTLITLVLRLAAIRWRVSLPEFEPEATQTASTGQGQPPAKPDEPK